MKIAKILSLIIIMCWVGVSLASINTGVSYLQSQQASNGTIGGAGFTGWAVMALAANGVRNTSAIDALRPLQTSLSSSPSTDVEKQILALVAAGEDPRTFENSNAVEVLKSRITNGQIGNADALNDDIFGLIALKAAGEPILSTVISGLVGHQNSDGGWGITVGGGSSSDMTALALIALKDTGTNQDVITRGLNYIKNLQNADGGFSTSGGESNVGSTTWVDWMIVSLGQSYADWQKSGHSSRDYITNQQDHDGSWFQSVLLTSYSLIALAQKGFPFIGATVQPTPTPTPTATPSPATTVTPSPVITASPTPSPIVTPTSSPRPSSTPSPLSTPIITPTPSPVMTLAPSPRPSVSASLPPLVSVVTLYPSPTPQPRPTQPGSLAIIASPMALQPVTSSTLEPITSPSIKKEVVFFPIKTIRTHSQPSSSPYSLAAPTPTPLPSSSDLQGHQDQPKQALKPRGRFHQFFLDELNQPYGKHIFFGVLLLAVNTGGAGWEVASAIKRAKK